MIPHWVSFLTDSSLSAIDNLIIWLNIVAASLSTAVSFCAIRRGVTFMRRAHALVTIYGFLYVILYISLIVLDINFMDWSQFMRGFSIPVWIVVWMYPAILSIRNWKRLEQEVTERIGTND